MEQRAGGVAEALLEASYGDVVATTPPPIRAQLVVMLPTISISGG